MKKESAKNKLESLAGDKNKNKQENRNQGLDDYKDKAAKRAEGKKRVFHHVFVAGIYCAAFIYTCMAFVWAIHEVVPESWRWLDVSKVMRLKDIILFVGISLLVGELKSAYRKATTSN